MAKLAVAGMFRLCLVALSVAAACGKVEGPRPHRQDTPADAGAGPTEAGAGGAANGAGGDGFVAAAGAPPDTRDAFKLSDGPASRLGTSSDPAGNALVVWNEGVLVRSALWSSARAQWSQLEAFEASDPSFVASPAGDFVTLASATESAQDSELVDLSTRRFDFERAAWSEPTSLPGTAWRDDWQVAVSANGDTHAFWRNPDGNYWSLWPAQGPDWEGAVTFDEAGRLVTGTASTFFWSERNELLVQTFDAIARTWSEPALLRDLTQQTPLRAHTLFSGRDDSALLLSNRRDPDQLVVETWRWDPGGAWGSVQTVMTIPATTDPSRLIGPSSGVADPLGDFVWVPVEDGNGDVTLFIARYDPEAGTWHTSHTLQGDRQSAQLDLLSGDAGHAYGYSPSVGLLRFEPVTDEWTNTPVGSYADLLTSARGAFAFAGAVDELVVVALKSDAGGEWGPAQGLPPDAEPTLGAPLATTLVAPETALVVWSESYGPHTGVWASFIE